jgi:hypothetical protein
MTGMEGLRNELMHYLGGRSLGAFSMSYVFNPGGSLQKFTATIDGKDCEVVQMAGESTSALLQRLAASA